METVKSTKKIELNFNERGFEKAVKANEGYVNSKKELIDTIDSYGVKGKELIKEAHIYKATAEAIYTLLSKDSHLPEGINKLKFLELFFFPDYYAKKIRLLHRKHFGLSALRTILLENSC